MPGVRELELSIEECKDLNKQLSWVVLLDRGQTWTKLKKNKEK